MPTPKLNIVVESACTTCPKKPVASVTDKAGKPARVRWHAGVKCEITFPMGFFQSYMTKDLIIKLNAGESSNTFKLSPNAPVGPVVYQLKCPAGSIPPNPPMIEIDN